MSKDDVQLRTALRKASGLESQIKYLAQLKTTRITQLIKQLNQQINKLDGKIGRRRGKMRRGKRLGVTKADLASMRQL